MHTFINLNYHTLMTHCLTRFVSGFVLLLASLIPAISANAATDGRFIYLAGGIGDSWWPPTTEYAGQYEAGKLYETSDGSNVYEGTFTLTTSWFRFYSALCEAVGPDDSTCWNRNVIAAGYTYDTTYLTSTVNDGILVSEDMEVANAVPQGYVLGSWFLPVGTYRLSVDLNRKRVVAAKEDAVVIVMSGQPEPSLSDFDDYVSCDGSNNYIPAGNLAFNPFNIFFGRWENPLPGCETLDATASYNMIQYANSDTRGEPFVMNGWNGGVMSFRPYSVESKPDVMSVPEWTIVCPEKIYVTGDHCNWDWNTAIVASFRADDCSYVFTLPAGSCVLKIKDTPDWGEGTEFAFAGVVVADEAGHKVMKLKQGVNLDNIAFDTPLESDMECVLRALTGELVLPGDAPIALQGNVEPELPSDVVYVFRKGDKFRPNAQSSYAVCSSFDMLTKGADGAYQGSLMLKAGEKLQFASELGNAGETLVVCPGTSGDRALHFVDNRAYSSATKAQEREAAYWSVPENADGLRVNVTVTAGENPSVQFLAPGWESGSRSEFYLRGSHSNWDALDEWEFVASGEKNVWVLRDKTIPAGTSFKVADANWGYINLGAPDFSDGYLYPNTPYALSSDNSGNLMVASDFTGDVVVSLSGTRYTITLETPGGNHMGGGQPDGNGLFYFKDGSMTAMESIGEGLFCGTVFVGSGEAVDLQLFTKDLPISPEEPEWACSYALGALTDGFVFEFDDMGVAECGYTVQNEVTTRRPQPLRLVNDSDSWVSCYVVVDTANEKIYVEKQSERYYLVGTLTAGKEISLANRTLLRGASIPACGGIVDFPAGDCDFIVAGSITDAAKAVYDSERDLTFINGIALAETGLFGWQSGRIKNIVRGWKGGKAVVGRNGLLDLSTVKTITAGNTVRGADGEASWQTTELKPASEGAAVFTGKVAYSKNVNGIQGITFYLNYDEDYDRQFQIGSTAFYLNDGSGAYLNKGMDILVDKNGVLEADMYCGGNAFALPTLVGSGELDVAIDVDAMKLTMTTAAGNTAPVFEAVAEEGSGLDGAVAYPSVEQENVVTLGTTVEGGADDVCEFNFATPEGSVIQPAEGESAVIDFDESGTWSGGFSIASSAAPVPSRHAVRRQAAGSAKWQFALPEGVDYSHILMSIDRNTNRLTVFSSAHNNNYFIVTADGGREILDGVSIENIDELKKNCLVKGQDGAYEGDFTVAEGADNIRVAFIQSFGTMFETSGYAGIGAMTSETAYSTFNLSEATEATQIAFGDASVSPWNVKASAGNVHVRFSPAENIMVFSREDSGVENVAADNSNSGLAVYGGHGCIRVVASAETVVSVYSTSGMLAASRRVEAGVTEIPLPAGFYIAGGKKLLVR